MKPGGMREYGCESGGVCVCVDECSQVSVMRPTVTVQVVRELVSDETNGNSSGVCSMGDIFLMLYNTNISVKV